MANHCARFGAGPAGAATIAEFIQHSSSVLHTADLANNRLGDVGVKELCTVLAASDVTTLNLAQNKVGTDGAKALSRVLQSTQCKLVSNTCMEHWSRLLFILNSIRLFVHTSRETINMSRHNIML